VSVAALANRVNTLGIRAKLTLFMAVLTVVVSAVVFAVVRVNLRERTRSLVTEELSRSQHVVLELQRRGVEQLLTGASIISQAPTLIAAVKTAQSEARTSGRARDELANTVEGELAKLADLFDRDLLIITDEHGHVFAAAARGDERGGGVPARGSDLSGMPALRRALDPGAPADVREFGALQSESAIYQLGVYPMVQGGYTAGALLLGQRLGDRFLDEARQATSSDVIVLAGSELVAATSLPDSAALLGAIRNANLAAGSTSTLAIGQNELAVARLSLGVTQAGTPVDLWLVQPFASEVDQLTRRLLSAFAVALLAVVLLSGVGAAVIARSVMRPFDRFVTYMRGVTGNDGRPPPFDRRDDAPEVATLADTFDQLMASLAVEREALVRRTTELVAANTGLREEVSERERVEHALRESEKQLRQSQRLEAIGTLAGGIAHDFNNLLTVISGYTQLASMATPSGSPLAADLRQVMDASDSAAKLTQQLLVFSRKQLLEPTVLDVGQVARSLSSMIRPLVGERIDFTLQIEDDLPLVFADPGQLEQVLINLVVNARDAMPDGGRLTIACTGDALDSETPGVRLEVIDTGHGIPDGIRERIFEPFFTTKQSHGTIDVISGSGGTTFRITLPAFDGIAELVALPSPMDVPVDGTETIMVVEDESNIRTLARRTLEGYGYRVITVGDPLEALELARKATVDLVLSDVVMPRMSGPEMVARMLGDRTTPLVVYMSGYADEAIQQYELGRGRTFLRKPFSPIALARTVRHALDSAKKVASSTT
jgi:signal transduction histidine kinase/ActR/RegA family two-component response regulator